MDARSSDRPSPAAPVDPQPARPEIRPDVEAIMAEIRGDAARASGQPVPPVADAEPRVYVGVDDEAVVLRVMERLAGIRSAPRSAAPLTPAAGQPPRELARELSFHGGRPRGWVHRQLGKARRWLFRVTKIQAELERLQGRLDEELIGLEQRTSQGLVQLQQYLAARSEIGGEPRVPELSLADPLYERLQARFRGSEEDIRGRAAEYLPFIREAVGRANGAGRCDLLDAGCGRGELLELARNAGLTVRGIDASAAMVERCRAKGLPVEGRGLGEFLLSCPAEEFRCVTLVHVVEHIPVAHLPGLLVEFKRIIAPGGRLIMEFPNIANLLTAANHFYIDYTHHRPLHRETVKLFCEAAGFTGVFSHELHPADERERLQPVDASLPGAGQMNEAIERLNRLLYGPRDVLVVAER